MSTPTAAEAAALAAVTPQRVATDIQLPLTSVSNVMKLLDEGATIPFIARYRKEMTGSLDETQIEQVAERRKYLVELESRRNAILESIIEQGKLTDELAAKIAAAQTKQELEDLYLPYKKKRRTRAMIARERGLGPLADGILAGEIADVEPALAEYVNAEKELPDVDAVRQGAKDIIAEVVAHDADVRALVRDGMWDTGNFVIEAGSDETADPEGKFKDLQNYQQHVNDLPGHRILAANRGERERALRVKLVTDLETDALKVRARFIKKPGTSAAELVFEAVAEGFDRLLVPSLEAEIRVDLTEQADFEAIDVFAENLKHLLMEPPLGPKVTMGIDPGFRTGCKVAVVGRSGDVLAHDVIYPVEPKHDKVGAARTVKALVEKHRVEYIAVGDGTGGRETETFLRDLVKAGMKVTVVVISEAGASVYSASEVAREEFPDLDLTVRSAISIARRLQDPLAELVKVDPKAIGVGQYQHDVNQKELKRALDRVVESCVNGVGVNLNTASAPLLAYVSGISPRIAKNIVAHREKNGLFESRKELLKVTGLGPKAFEQCAGFLRILGGTNVLDNTAVHPERYAIVERMAQSLGLSVEQLAGSGRLQSLKPQQFVAEAEGVGLPTITDIINELKRPGRDVRGEFKAFEFADVHDINDLEAGMVIPGIIKNVTKFGAFVDIGVHRDGLVHVSEMADRYVADPSEIVKVGQKVTVRVTEVDHQRKRIGLTMRGLN